MRLIERLRWWAHECDRTNHGCQASEMLLEAADEIERLQSETEPVRHGRWVLGYVEPGYCTPGGNRPWVCSECGQIESWSLNKPEYKYCHCGARMDGENEYGTEN